MLYTTQVDLSDYFYKTKIVTMSDYDLDAKQDLEKEANELLELDHCAYDDVDRREPRSEQNSPEPRENHIGYPH